MNRTYPTQAYGSTVIKAVNTALTHNLTTLQAIFRLGMGTDSERPHGLKYRLYTHGDRVLGVTN